MKYSVLRLCSRMGSKMVSNKAKGSKHEKECQIILEGQQFVTMRSPRTMTPIGPGRYISRDCDYWNLYDVCAKKAGWTRWIQVKSTASGVSSAKKPIKEFHDAYNSSNTESSEIWLRVAKKGWVVYCYNPKEDEWVKEFFTLKGVQVDPFTYTGGKTK